MLQGIAPIIIFQIYKLLPEVQTTLASIPIVSTSKKKQTFAIIPIYLDMTLTGLVIDAESKNIDIKTEPDTTTDGEPGSVNQSALGSITTINLKGLKGSIGLTILLSLSEVLLDKLGSQEYEITYMNGAVTVFGGLLHGFSYDQGGDDDLYNIKIELSRGRPKTKPVEVGQDPTAVRLGTTGATPPATAPTVTVPPGGANTGKSAIQPNVSVPRT